MMLARRTNRLAAAGVTIAAVIASFCCSYALCRWAHAQPGPAILSAILALSLSRREHSASDGHVLVVPATIGATAVVAAGVGWLLVTVPALGAIVFTAGMFLSVWLRNLGARGRIAGSLVALPLVGMLVVPARADAPGGVTVDLALIIAAGVFAYAFAAVFGSLARRAGITPPIDPHRAARTPAGAPAAAAGRLPAAAADRKPAAANDRGSKTRWSPTTRLALQMATAVGSAFLAGFALFPAHWSWCVFTAFIVSSGARSRGDAAYKGVLRLGGALAGTLAATILTRLWLPSGISEAATIFAILFVGVALRESNYAYWAACMTLVLALLAAPGAAGLAFLGVRLEAIVAGALCAALAAWYVMPITVEAVIRRRLADALAALDDFAAGEHASEAERANKLAIVEKHMAELEAVAPPARWHRRLFARSTGAAHPAAWIDLAQSVHRGTRAIDVTRARDARHRASVRRAIGISRRAIAQHGKPDTPKEAPSVAEALQRLHDLVHGSDWTSGAAVGNGSAAIGTRARARGGVKVEAGSDEGNE